MISLLKRLFGFKYLGETNDSVTDQNAPQPPLLQIGRLDSRCPYCEAGLQKRPKAKVRCKTCGNYIRVRWDAKGQSTLLREDQLVPFDDLKFASPEFANSRAEVEAITITPFGGANGNVRAPMRVKIAQFAEQYCEIADKAAFANFIVENFGARSESLVDLAAARFNLHRSGANLIVRHATSVASAFYSQRRAQSVGSKKYVWHALHGSCVCSRCAELDGKTFHWDAPPAGGHPGEFECWRISSPDYDKTPAGRFDLKCPSCETDLAMRPRARSKCKTCQSWIWPKTNADGHPVLLNEEMLADFDRQKTGPEICRCMARPILDLTAALENERTWRE